MISSKRRDWLQRQLIEDGVTWKVLGNQVTMAPIAYANLPETVGALLHPLGFVAAEASTRTTTRGTATRANGAAFTTSSRRTPCRTWLY